MVGGSSPNPDSVSDGLAPRESVLRRVSDAEQIASPIRKFGRANETCGKATSAATPLRGAERGSARGFRFARPALAQHTFAVRLPYSPATH